MNDSTVPSILRQGNVSIADITPTIHWMWMKSGAYSNTLGRNHAVRRGEFSGAQERIELRRNRVNPRVVKRKMSKWKKKRPEHRSRPPLKKTFADTVVIT
jgi:hypothetical protein